MRSVSSRASNNGARGRPGTLSGHPRAAHNFNLASELRSPFERLDFALRRDYRLAGAAGAGAAGGAAGVRGPVSVVAEPVVEGGSFGALAVGGRLMPLLALSRSPLPDANTNNNTAAT